MSAATGLYIHIPFCHHRCTYCDFNIYAGMQSLYERYARAVAREIASSQRPSENPPPRHQGTKKSSKSSELLGALVSWWLMSPQGARGRAATIYFGGGTPSLVQVEHIAIILDAIRASFDVQTDAEISLEANPRTDDDGYFARLRSLGVNRVSLGMQSANERDLHLFRRGHTFDDVARTFRIARSAGFDNLNLDLIYGIPGQSLDDWRVTLQAALSLGPEHISAYGLQVEDGTTLKKWIAQGKVLNPDDDLAADMYDLAEAMLADAGFLHYEISNWAQAIPTSSLQPPRHPRQQQARAGQTRDPQPCRSRAGGGPPTSNLQLPTSQHNTTYWRNDPYLGFGCGAHSWFGGRRFSNVRHPREYIARIEAGQGVEVEAETIGRELEMGETMMVGLRLLEEGVTFDRFGARFGVDLREVYRAKLDQLLAQGLIVLDSERVKLSRQAWMVGNRVFGEFLPDSGLGYR